MSKKMSKNVSMTDFCKTKVAPCDPECANKKKVEKTCRAKNGEGDGYTGPKAAVASPARPAVAAARPAVAAARTPKTTVDMSKFQDIKSKYLHGDGGKSTLELFYAINLYDSKTNKPLDHKLLLDWWNSLNLQYDYGDVGAEVEGFYSHTNSENLMDTYEYRAEDWYIRENFVCLPFSINFNDSEDQKYLDEVIENARELTDNDKKLFNLTQRNDEVERDNSSVIVKRTSVYVKSAYVISRE